MVTYALNMWEPSSSLEKRRPGGGQWKKRAMAGVQEHSLYVILCTLPALFLHLLPFLSLQGLWPCSGFPSYWIFLSERVFSASSPPSQCNHSDISTKPWENLFKYSPPPSSSPPIEVYLHMGFTAQRWSGTFPWWRQMEGQSQVSFHPWCLPVPAFAPQVPCHGLAWGTAWAWDQSSFRFVLLMYLPAGRTLETKKVLSLR